MNKNSLDKTFFKENGYIQLNNIIKQDNEFNRLSQEIIKETNVYFQKNLADIKKLGGYLTGNLELLPDKKIKDIWNILCNEEFKKKFEFLTEKKISDLNIKYTGNIVLPKKGYQHFHTDGPLKSNRLIVNVAIHQINKTNAPTEIVPSTHNRKIKFWKFYLYEFFKKKKFVEMNIGDVLIRNHSIWHRGTKNKSDNLRILLFFLLTEKSADPNFKQTINKNLLIGENQFKSSYKQKVKELISIYLAPVYIFYRIISSLIK